MVSLVNKFLEWVKADYWRSAFVFLVSALFFVVIRLSLDAGMSGDEHFHAKHARDVYEFYKTFGNDTIATTITEENNLPTYGQVVDNLAYAIYHWFGFDNEMTVRHIVNSIFGWLAILFTAMIGFRVSKKWFTSILILLLMFFSPRFLGHSFNNLKDLPLATAMIMGLYYILVFLQDFPKVKKTTMAMLAISIGFAIAVRIGGLLLIAYFGLFCAILFLKDYGLASKNNKNKKLTTVKSSNLKVQKTNSDNKKVFGKMFKWGLFIVLTGYIIGMLLWPYGLISPIEHPKFVLTYMSKFATSLRQNFEGTMQWSNLLPWYYTSKFILFTIPVAVIFGIILYPVFGGLKKNKWFETFVVAFAFIFPIFWITYTKANVYGGWRHSMFAYPPMAAVAGLGYSALAEWISKKIKKPSNNFIYILVLVGVVGLLYSPIRHIFKNHPYEYVYFNELAGGTKKAYGQYELDYYYHSTRAASEWIIANAEKSGLETGNKIKVATWHTPSVAYFFRNDTAKFEVGFSRWYERGNNDWDYAVFVTTGINPAVLQNGTYPPANTVHTIEVDGVPIASVLKRTDKKDYYGYLKMQEGNVDSAKLLFRQSLEILPKNESVLTNLANIYLQQGLFDSVIFYTNQFLAFEPTNENANYMAALANYYKRDFNQALFHCKKINGSNGYSLSANIYLQMNDIYSAEKELLKLMDAGAFDQNAANQLMNIYKAQGFDERVAQRKMFKHLAESFRKLGNKELAQQYEAASMN